MISAIAWARRKCSYPTILDQIRNIASRGSAAIFIVSKTVTLADYSGHAAPVYTFVRIQREPPIEKADMTPKTLTFHRLPELQKSRMIIGFSGWMDGGQVSTGTIEYLANQLDTEKLASIDPEPYYIYSFPGPMEVSALFRPHTRIEAIAAAVRAAASIDGGSPAVSLPNTSTSPSWKFAVV